MKKLICLILSAVLIMPDFIASSSGSKVPMEDKEFFGVWNEAQQSWSQNHPGVLDYKGDKTWEQSGKDAWSENEKSRWLAIENYAKAGDYENAKLLLHTYYKERTNNSFKDTYTTSTVRNSKATCDMYISNFRWNLTSMLSKATFTENYGKVSFDVTGRVKSGGSYTFVLLGYNTNEELVMINSRENTSEKPILVVVANGITHRISPSKDTTIKANANSNKNYGGEQYLYVKEEKPSETTLFGAETQRAYLQFDVSSLSGITKATLELFGKTVSGNTEVSVWTDDNTVWSENGLTWSNAAINILNFNGCEGGVNWQLMLTDTKSGINNELAGWMGRGYWMTTLARYASYSKSQAYADAAIAQIKDFIYDAEFSSLSREGVGYNNSLTTAIRAREFTAVFYQLLPYMSYEDCTFFLKYMWLLTDYLSKPENFRADHNWGTFQLYGYLRNATFLTEFKQSKSWLDHGIERFGLMVDSLFHSVDGSYKEASSSYGVTALNGLFNIKDEIAKFGIDLPQEQKEKLRKGVSYLINTNNPDGTDIIYGDSHYQRHDMTRYVDYLEDETLRYIITNGQQGVMPDYESIAYPHGGNKFAVMRNGWSKDSLALYTNNGAGNGLSHTHPDNLAITAYGYGERLLVDVGNYSYDNIEVSNWQRLSTQAHNTVTINSQAQDKKRTDPISIWRTNKAFNFFSATTYAYGGFPHTRDIYFMKEGFWIVSDLIVPANGGINHYEQNWHTLPYLGVSIDNTLKMGRTNHAQKANIKIIQADKAGITVELKNGYTNAQDDMLMNSQYMSFVQSKSGAASYNTVLYPTRPGENPEVAAESIDLGVGADVASAMTITVGGRKTQYYISKEAVPNRRAFGEFEYTGKAAYIDMSGDIKTVHIIDGNLLTHKGKLLVSSKKQSISDLEVKWEGDFINLTSSLSFEQLASLGVEIYAFQPPSQVFFNGKEIKYKTNADSISFGELNELSYILNEGFEALEVGTYKGHNRFIFYTGPSDKVTGQLFIVEDMNGKKLRLYRNNKYPGRNASFSVAYDLDLYQYASFEVKFSSNPASPAYQDEKMSIRQSGGLGNQNCIEVGIKNGKFYYLNYDETFHYLNDKISFVLGNEYYVRVVVDRINKVYSLYIDTNSITDNTNPLAVGIPLISPCGNDLAQLNSLGYQIFLEDTNFLGGNTYFDYVVIKNFSKNWLPDLINSEITIEKSNGEATAKAYVAGKNAKSVLVLAKYKDGCLISIGYVPFSNTKSGAEILNVKTTYDDDETVKAFLWEDIKRILPLTPNKQD